MIALTATALFALLRDPVLAGAPAGRMAWPVLLASSCATLLVMSLLHGDLQNMYRKLVEAEERAQDAARRDELTGLGNRKFLFEKLEHYVGLPEQSGSTVLLLVDLDHFKRVNDTLGHAAGDQLIKVVAERLKSIAHDAEIVRLGGDEFALIVETRDRDALVTLCDRIVASLSLVIRLAQGDCFISGSVGAAYLEDGLGVSELMRRADLAMYKAKSEVRGARIYDQEMSDEAYRRASLATALCKSLETGEGLATHYQRIVTPAGELHAIEALLRWKHSEFGEVPVREIISVAEERHLINEVGLFVAREVCQAAKAFPEAIVCFNVAAIQLLDLNFSTDLIDILAKNGVSPAQIQIEMREREFVERAREIGPTFEHLAGAGFHLAVDDFGSSISSLSQLQKLGVTVVKLDHNVLEDAREMASIAVIQAKVGLARSLGMIVICEGVNDEIDEATAIQSGCDFLQGYRYGRPTLLASLSAEEQTPVLRALP